MAVAGRARTLRASSGVRFAHMATSLASSVPRVALWMHTKVLRRVAALAGCSPPGPAACIDSHASNCVQKRERYEMSTRHSTEQPR